MQSVISKNYSSEEEVDNQW